MQVSSISSGSFGNMSVMEQLSDSDLRQLAYAKASHDVNDKRHRRINNLLFYSVPLVAGVAEAVKPSSISRIGRLGAGLRGFAAIAIPFAVIDAVFGLKSFADKHSETSASFTKEHPVATLLTTLGVSVVGLLALNKGLGKLGAKYGDKIAEKFAPKVAVVAEKLNASKLLNKGSKLVAKIPSSIKEFSKIALDWAPWMLIFANIGHTINHEKVKNNEYMKNYETLKNIQCELDA